MRKQPPEIQVPLKINGVIVGDIAIHSDATTSRDIPMVTLDKSGLVAEVELRDKDNGEHIGTGFVERTKTGYVIVHVDLSKIPEHAYSGFSIGPILVREEEIDGVHNPRS